MSELEEAWELALVEARRRARASGRADIADYLDLRSRNDLLRRTAIDWLTQTLIALAAEANRRGSAIQIEQTETHRFRHGPATMVGPQITLRHGLRALTVESGWPRVPRDGFVRGGGLACANLKHFGRQRSNAELLLMNSAHNSPQWFLIDKHGERALLTEAHLRKHFAMLAQD